MSIHKTGETIPGSQAALDQFVDWQQEKSRSAAASVLSEKLETAAAKPLPPSNNMGGNPSSPPLFLPSCETSTVFVDKNKTNIDWLAYTSSCDLVQVEAGVSVLFPSAEFSTRAFGMCGFPQSKSISVDGVQFGLVGFGASHERVFVSLTGTACKTVTGELIPVMYEMLKLLEARISRIDICFDFYKGEQTFDHALRAYHETDGFKSSKGGRTPQIKLVGTTAQGKNLGRTMYVGKREGSEKMCRIYEKGLEVFANMPEELRAASEARELVFGTQERDLADNWLRVEVEFKRQDRDLPLEMILQRDKYFAGAYPYCAACLKLSDGLRPPTMKGDLEISLAKMIGNAKRSYGSMVHSLIELGCSDRDVVEYLSTGKNNEKLVRSGLLGKLKGHVAEWRADNLDWDIPF